MSNCGMIFLHVASIVLVTFACVSAAQSTTTFTLGLGAPYLLSGSLAACIPDATQASCVGGIASFEAFARNLSTDKFTLIPEIDVATPFVQMHPDGLSVNLDVYRRVNVTNFFAYPSFFTQSTNFSRFWASVDVRPIASNLDAPTSNRWRHTLVDFVVEEVKGVRISVTRVLQSGQSWVNTPVEALIATIQNMRSVSDIVVVTSGDINYPFGTLLPLLGENLPDVFVDVSASSTSSAFTAYRPSTYNGTRTTYVATAALSYWAGIFVTIEAQIGTKTLLGVTLKAVDITALSSSLKDGEYYDLQDNLKEMALLASSNDPELSHTLESVPQSRTGNVYPCFAGECAQGTLYAAAYHWRYDVDIGMTNSGGPRGPGWPAGVVKTSDVWGLIPFANYPCTGTILGLKVWELVNASMSYCTFNNEYSTTGDRFLQMYGIQIDFDNSTASITAGTRVRAIRVLDKSSGVYKPLERLKYYTFATDTYGCTSMPVISALLAPSYDGEFLTSKVADELVQTSIQLYLKAHDPYSPVFTNYLTNIPVSASTSSSFMVWAQTIKSCSDTQYWDGNLGTCIDCPTGFQRSATDGTLCVSIPDNSNSNSTTIAIVVPIIVVVAVVGLLLVVALYLRSTSKVRNTKHAPKGETAAIIFTDIQMSTKLWGTVPASMGVALDQHHAMIRDAIAVHHGYEVKTVGDSFMIAVETCQQAVDLAQQIQLDFMAVAWPKSIGQVYAAESCPEMRERIDDEPTDTVTEGIDATDVMTVDKSNVAKNIEEFSVSEDEKKPAPALSKLFHGVRVRIGIHYGPVEAIFDEVAKGYDYYGNTVNVAARIESSGDGGQIVVSRDVASRISANDEKYRLELLGSVELRGVTGPTELLQLSPLTLIGRQFTAKAIDKINKSGQQKNAEQDGGSQGNEASTGSHPSQFSAQGQPSDKELVIRDTITRVFKPFKGDLRHKQLALLAKAWHVSLPKFRKDHATGKREELSEGDKGDVTINVVAQRIAAVQTITLQSGEHSHLGVRGGALSGMERSGYSSAEFRRTKNGGGTTRSGRYSNAGVQSFNAARTINSNNGNLMIVESDNFSPTVNIKSEETTHLGAECSTDFNKSSNTGQPVHQDIHQCEPPGGNTNTALPHATFVDH